MLPYKKKLKKDPFHRVKKVKAKQGVMQTVKFSWIWIVIVFLFLET